MPLRSPLVLTAALGILVPIAAVTARAAPPDLAFPGETIDALAAFRDDLVRRGLAHAGVAIIDVVGDRDDVVPPAENALVVEERYRALGGTIEVVREPGKGHHPHGLANPRTVVDFIIAHAAQEMNPRP